MTFFIISRPKIIIMSRYSIILSILMLCFSFSSQAQGALFKKLPYTIDTITYKGYKVARQRSNPGDIEDYRTKNSAAVRDLIALQDALEKQEPGVSDAYACIGRLKNMALGFDLHVYEQEAAVYMKLRDQGNTTNIAKAPVEGKPGSEKTEQQLVDSTIKLVGSLDEAMYNNDIRKKSNNQYRVLYCDYKTIWNTFLTSYMDKFMSCSTPKNANGEPIWAAYGDDGMQITVPCNGKSVSIKLKASIPADNIPVITQVTITGESELLAALFLNYWEIKGIEKSKLAKGALYTHDFLSDHITFDWKAEAPVITITPNPVYRGYLPGWITRQPSKTNVNPSDLNGKSREEIISNYGSVDEYIYENDIAKRSSHHKKTILISHPATLHFNLLNYIRDKYHYDFRDKDGKVLGEVVNEHSFKIRSVLGDKQVETFVEVCGAQGNSPACSSTITGEPPVLTDLFLSYWENKTIAKVQLKKGVEISQDFMSDHITFNWKGDTPFISITSNLEN